jgi:hypothetical protein
MNVVRGILHVEGVAVLAASLWLYFVELEASWIAFAVLILAPDVSMLGYVRSARLGAWLYDLMHNYALALALIVVGVATDEVIVEGLGFILSAHVGMDRAMGYGLKYTIGFRDTHLQRVA